MKKALLSLIVLFCFSLTTFAQSTIKETVYLKNGSIINGREMIPVI